MIKVFIPVIKGRVKASIRGFWRNEAGKTFYDYLRLSNRFYLLAELEAIQKRYNQEAIAYIDKGILKIFYSRNKIEVLSHCIFKEVLRGNLKAEIREALKVYGGITIYKKDNRYFKEIFYK
jgi:hypothetical protein